MSINQRIGHCVVMFPGTPVVVRDGDSIGYQYSDGRENEVKFSAWLNMDLDVDLESEASILAALDKLFAHGEVDGEKIEVSARPSTLISLGAGRAQKRTSMRSEEHRVESLFAIDRQGQTYALGVAMPASRSTPALEKAIADFLAPIW